MPSSQPSPLVALQQAVGGDERLERWRSSAPSRSALPGRVGEGVDRRRQVGLVERRACRRSRPGPTATPDPRSRRRRRTARRPRSSVSAGSAARRPSAPTAPSAPASWAKKTSAGRGVALLEDRRRQVRRAGVVHLDVEPGRGLEPLDERADELLAPTRSRSSACRASAADGAAAQRREGAAEAAGAGLTEGLRQHPGRTRQRAGRRPGSGWTGGSGDGARGWTSRWE